ncbi:MAG TPA: ATP-binding protein [Acidimicrobiia bacterium]|nr:ATP-binding protein [Acidimicrobiia bacterium]
MTVEQHFEPEVGAIAAARHFVAEAVDGNPRVDDVVIVTSELVSNVVRHAVTPLVVKVVRDHMIRIEVSDGSSILPAVEELAESYRGLRLIEAASDGWGVELTETGKTVWVEFLPQTPGLLKGEPSPS